MNAPSPRAFAADDVVGGYQLVRKAGKGGMAEVWFAKKASGRGRPVALKVILPHLAGQERYGRMFRAEADVSSMMSHSNIVQVFDEGDDGGVSYMVMEWVDGINLVRLREALKLIPNTDIRTSMTASVIGQLLHALSYAHELTSPEGTPLGIVHRDISPQNVLVTTSGDVKLLDFGVAHTVIEESSGMHVKGKLRYMAPEQLTTRVKAPTLDLFGVGALLHELLDGQRFRGDFKDDRQLHAQVMRGIVPQLRVSVAPELERLRSALLAADPAQRVSSAAGALELLRAYRGYRDRRVELSKVVGSLTGATKPRTGVSKVERSNAASPAPAGPAPGPAPVAPAPAPLSPGPAPLAPGPAPVAPAPAPLSPGPAPLAPGLAPGPGPGLAAHAPGSATPPAAARPEATMFLDGGGLPGGALQQAGAEPAAPVAEATTFLPNPAHAPVAEMGGEEATSFLAPPSPHGSPHGGPRGMSVGGGVPMAAPRPPSRPASAVGPRPASAVTPRPASQVAPPAVAPPPGSYSMPAGDDQSMTRFVVEESSTGRTILMFLAGLVLALGAVGGVAWFILGE